MKKIFCLLTFLACIATARANLVFSDGFTYPDGNLVGAFGSSWTAHDAVDSLPVQIVSGQARIAASNASAQDINVLLPGGPYPSNGSATVIYVGFTVRFTILPSAAGSYFAHINTSLFRCRLWASTANAVAGKFRLGAGNYTGASASSGQITDDLSLNTDYSLVVRYELATGLSTIWLNPAAETDPGVTASDSPGTSLPSVSTFAFRQASGIGAMLIDNLVIGTSFADVVGGNLPPSISAIATQSIPASGNTGPLPLAVGDDQTPADNLALSASSDNQALVPGASIVFAGSGGNRTVTVTPTAGQQGQVNITLSVNDGSTTASTSFLLKVGAPIINAIANQITPINTDLGPLGFTAADAEEGAGALTASADSSNQLLLSNGNIFFGGTGATRTLTASPAAGQTGTTTITVTVDDGNQLAAQSFVLTVHPVLGVLAGDDFNRPDEVLVDAVTWIGHSGLYGEMAIIGNKLALSQNASEDVNLHLTTGTLYPAEGGHVFFASFVANFSALPAGAGNYFAHFKDDTNLGFRGRVIATVSGAAPGALRLGIASASGTVAATSLHPTQLSLNTDYLVVIRLNAATGECRLWVNPSVEATGFVDSTDAPLPSLIQSFAFRQTGPPDTTAGIGVLTVDNLKIATSFAEVLGFVRPTLGFQRTGNNLRLTWPTGQGYFLRRASALPATSWSNVQFVTEGAVDVSNLDIATGNGYLRLEKP